MGGFAFNRFGALDSVSHYAGEATAHGLVFDLGMTPMDRDEFDDVLAALAGERDAEEEVDE